MTTTTGNVTSSPSSISPTFLSCSLGLFILLSNIRKHWLKRSEKGLCNPISFQCNMVNSTKYAGKRVPGFLDFMLYPHMIFFGYNQFNIFDDTDLEQ
ncbi:hypothetical protein L1887_08244 [Cichorium endivia]|nr:hypothetical protein L1887_08244 [Cichorium endivia]